MTDKEQSNNLSRYLGECDKNQDDFDRAYVDDMLKLDEYINDAYEHIEKAIAELWNQHDTFSQMMYRKDFDDLIIIKLKELM